MVHNAFLSVLGFFIDIYNIIWYSDERTQKEDYMENNRRSISDIISFSNSILNVIRNNKDLMDRLRHLVKNGLITKDSILFFQMGENLINEVCGRGIQEDIASSNLQIIEKVPKRLSLPEQIDGVILSEKELMFQRMTSDNFNEGRWLKKARIRW